MPRTMTEQRCCTHSLYLCMHIRIVSLYQANILQFIYFIYVRKERLTETIERERSTRQTGRQKDQYLAKLENVAVLRRARSSRISCFFFVSRIALSIYPIILYTGINEKEALSRRKGLKGMQPFFL